MLIVSGDEGLLGRIDRTLWEMFPEDFLAHGRAGQPHEDRQPILLSDECSAANGAELLALADGRWREEAEGFARVLVFFDDVGKADARTIWRQFDGREDVEREFFELTDGKWLKRA